MYDDRNSMRYQADHKEQTHRRIVGVAAREFRASGFEGVGIGKLMGALKLTHGGFYAHFEDKEDLVSQASVEALDQSMRTMVERLEAGGFPAMLDLYLSEEHRAHPEGGCPLPSLAAEVARRPAATREAFTEKLHELFEAVAAYLPDESPRRKLEKARTIFAAMAGAVSLARAVSDPALGASILQSTKDHLLRFVQEA